MKKLLIASCILLLAFTSCKKDRTCSCTITYVSSTDNGVQQPLLIPSFTDVKKITNVTKNDAHCNSGEQTETRTQVVNGTSHTTVDVINFKCTLE